MKKKNVFVSLILAAAFLGSCTDREGDPGSAAEIRVGAEVLTTLTRAPIVAKTEFTAAITAVEVTGGDLPDWTAEPTGGAWWQNSLTLIASSTVGASVGLDNPKEYHATRTTHLAAWHPNVKSVKGVVTFRTGTGAGTQDVMWGGTLSGSRATPIREAFRFTHALTQLNFVARASGDFLSGGNEVIISAIEVQAARLPESLTIADGELTYGPAATLTVPGSKTLKLTATAAPFGEPLMIGAMKEVKIKVTYRVGEDANQEVTATINDVTLPGTPLEVLAGRSHKITLILGKNGLDISASVEDWKDGNGGAVNL